MASLAEGMPSFIPLEIMKNYYFSFSNGISNTFHKNRIKMTEKAQANLGFFW